MEVRLQRLVSGGALCLGTVLGGCAHAPEQTAPVAARPDVAQDEDPPFAFPVLLHESQKDSSYYFSYGGGVYTKQNVLTNAVETTIIILADAHGVTNIHGVETWFDGWGRIHTVSVLRRQLDYNAELAKRGPVVSFRDQPRPAYAVVTLPVTGILDRPTMEIPVNRLRNRLWAVRRGLDASASSAADPPALSALRSAVKEAQAALDRCDEAIGQVPLDELQENPNENDHSHYEGHFTGGLPGFIVLDQPDSDALKALKAEPHYAQYFREHDLYGLSDLELPTDELSEPPPTDRYSAEYGDYMRYSEYVRSQREAFKPVPLGYGWPRSDEAYVRAYVDPTKVDPNLFAEVDRRVKEAEAAVSAAENAEQAKGRDNAN